jgi:hypothetical protein
MQITARLLSRFLAEILDCSGRRGKNRLAGQPHLSTSGISSKIFHRYVLTDGEAKNTCVADLYETTREVDY